MPAFPQSTDPNHSTHPIRSTLLLNHLRTATYPSERRNTYGRSPRRVRPGLLILLRVRQALCLKAFTSFVVKLPRAAQHPSWGRVLSALVVATCLIASGTGTSNGTSGHGTPVIFSFPSVICALLLRLRPSSTMNPINSPPICRAHSRARAMNTVPSTHRGICQPHPSYDFLSQLPAGLRLPPYSVVENTNELILNQKGIRQRALPIHACVVYLQYTTILLLSISGSPVLMK